VPGIDSAQQVGITIEPEGGSDQPTQAPIMAFQIA
jgi:hypothetical protein